MGRVRRFEHSWLGGRGDLDPCRLRVLVLVLMLEPTVVFPVFHVLLVFHVSLRFMHLVSRQHLEGAGLRLL